MLQQILGSILVELDFSVIERFADMIIIEELHVDMTPNLSLEWFESEFLVRLQTLGVF